MDSKIILSRMRRSYFFMIGLCCLILVLCACYFGPSFLKWDYETNSLIDRFAAPDGFLKGLDGHILGTDALGRDQLVRVLIGGQNSIRLALTVVALQAVLGSVLGTVAGYFGGLIDIFIMRICDVLLTMPTMILAISVMAILGPSQRNLILVMTLTSWVQLCKVTRNNVRVVKQQDFVSASKVLGAKGLHIMFTQVFPNVTTNIIIITSQRLGVTILLESALSYLNLGIQPPMPSWGNMIASGRIYLTTQPWLILVPGFALMLAVLSFNFLGDGIRDVLDTKRKV